MTTLVCAMIDNYIFTEYMIQNTILYNSYSYTNSLTAVLLYCQMLEMLTIQLMNESAGEPGAISCFFEKRKREDVLLYT